MITFDKIVKKLWTKSGQIISINDFQKWFFPLTDAGKTSAYKLASRLMSNQIIIPIKNGLYYISSEDIILSDQIIDELYWKILKKLLRDEVEWKYIIVGNKALELLLRDFSIPEKLYIYTKDVSKIIKLSKDHSIIFRTICWWKRLWWENIFTKLSKHSRRIEIDRNEFLVADVNLALLDALTIHNTNDWINILLTQKAIKKFSKLLNKEKLWELVGYKYLTAINRLREITKEMNENSLYRQCVDIINRNWASCFITTRKT